MRFRRPAKSKVSALADPEEAWPVFGETFTSKDKKKVTVVLY